MLAENFMTAKALDLTDEQHAALVKTLRHLETGRADGGFDMSAWWMHVKRQTLFPGCGTSACIGGWAQFLVGEDVFREAMRFKARFINPRLDDLMFAGVSMGVTDPALGAAALRNYLTTGEARWDEVLAG